MTGRSLEDELRLQRSPFSIGQRPLRPIVFDLSHIVSRLMVRAPSGIDRVDMMYARYLTGDSSRLAAATHYALRNPNLLSPEQAGVVVRRADALWRERERSDADPQLAQIVRWLDQTEGPHPIVTKPDDAMPLAEWSERFLATWRFRLTFQFGGHAPKNALYLNCAQYLFEHPIFFRWLDQRSDIAKVFFVHDLLPLDYPEFFRDGYRARFERRLAMIMRHASALIVASEAVRERTKQEFRSRGLDAPPFHVAPLPATQSVLSRINPIEARTPYFVTVGTIEPRKNHLLLLNVWRELARGHAPVPRLLIVGARGWENEQAVDAIERSSAIRPHVLEVSGLCSASLKDLIAGSQALLMPSFDEGFGLPIVEALSLGTPVIASDRPIFREVSQGCATFLNPIDGMAWLSAIRAAAAWTTSEGQAIGAAAREIKLPNIDSYFESVFGFLDCL